MDSETRLYQRRTGDTEVTGYGMETVIRTAAGGRNVTITSKSVNNPPATDLQHRLAVGESATQSTTATTTTPGVPGQATRTATSTATQTVKFVARENVRVPAGTYATCRFETRIAGAASAVTTTWVIAGKGITVRTERRVNGVLSGTTQQATAVKLNGRQSL